MPAVVAVFGHLCADRSSVGVEDAGGVLLAAVDVRLRMLCAGRAVGRGVAQANACAITGATGVREPAMSDAARDFVAGERLLAAIVAVQIVVIANLKVAATRSDADLSYVSLAPAGLVDALFTATDQRECRGERAARTPAVEDSHMDKLSQRAAAPSSCQRAYRR